MRKLRVTADAVGRGQYFLDGEDISEALNGVQISLQADQPTQILLSLSPREVELDIEGLPHIVDRASLIVEDLDPAYVEKKALERMGFDGDTESMTEAILLTIKDLIHGT